MTVPPRTLPWLGMVVLGVTAVWFVATGQDVGRALLAGILFSTVVETARRVVPREPIAGVMATIVLALAPPVRDAIAHDAPSLLLAISGCRALLAILSACNGQRPSAIASAVIAAGVLIVAVTGVAGALPPLMPGIAAIVTESGRGAAAIVVAAGLLGAAFGTLTGLRGARWILAAIAVVAITGLVVPLLATLAIGAAIVPAGVVRAVAGSSEGIRRHVLTAAAGLPLLLAAVVL